MRGSAQLRERGNYYHPLRQAQAVTDDAGGQAVANVSPVSYLITSGTQSLKV